MAKTFINKEIASRAVRYIISIAGEGKIKFSVGKYKVIPKAAVLSDGTLVTYSRSLPVLDAHYGIESVIIDVVGLCKNKVTQIEIYRDGTIVYSPKINRDEEEVKEFVRLLAGSPLQVAHI